MKRIAAIFSIIGVASGVFVALRPWFYGGWNLASASFLMPLIYGVVLTATHWFTFRRIQTGSGTRFGLLVPNAVLLVVILLGFLYFPRNPASDDQHTLGAALLAAVYLLPLACNVLYLSFKRQSVEGLPYAG